MNDFLWQVLINAVVGLFGFGLGIWWATRGPAGPEAEQGDA